MTALRRTLFALLILLTCCAEVALARVSGKIEIGWNGTYRVSRWTPVFITLADDRAAPARNVTLEVLAPHDNSFAMRIFQQFAISTEPTTHTIYVPLTYALNDTILVVKDAGSGRKLFDSTFENRPVNGQFQGPFANAAQGKDDVVIGVSGRNQIFGSIQGNWRWTDKEQPKQPNQSYGQPTIRSGFLDERRLPGTMQGYDSLDLLVLNAIDLASMRLEPQQAIAQWVRGGGRLLLWHAPGPIPPESPIAQLLPCTIGEADVVNFSLADTRVIGLASRQEKIGGRRLEPLPHARTQRILNDKAIACFGRAGLGEVGVLSIDASQLAFESSEKPKDFWRPILRELVQPSEQSSTNYGYGNLSSEEQRRLVAMEAVVDQLGDVPGVGKFDFSYIAIVMIAMMIIVGPVDWLVLKKLGRQPWTWVTTAGWIVLITTGALYIGYIFRSGDLYYRSVRLVDQADGQVVGAMDVLGIYSPKTQRYFLAGPRNEWWEPANIEAVMPWRQQQRAIREISFVQDADGNRLVNHPDFGGMTVNVWSLQFMEGELNDPASEPPILKADLRRVGGADGKWRIVGTITNLSSVPLKDVSIRTSAGVATVGAAAATQPAQDSNAVPPGQTITIDVPIALTDSFKPPENVNYNYHYYGQSYENPYADPKNATQSLLRATCDLAAKRSERIERLLADRKDMACVYATCEMPTPVVKLNHGNSRPAMEKHWQIVRALVEMK